MSKIPLHDERQLLALPSNPLICEDGCLALACCNFRGQSERYVLVGAASIIPCMSSRAATGAVVAAAPFSAWAGLCYAGIVCVPTRSATAGRSRAPTSLPSPTVVMCLGTRPRRPMRSRCGGNGGGGKAMTSAVGCSALPDAWE